MGLRDQINRNPSLVTAVTAVVIVGTLIYMAFQLGFFRGDEPVPQPIQDFEALPE